VEGKEGVVQGVAGGPRRLADQDMPVPAGALELVDRDHGALPGPHVSYDYEVAGKVDGAENREDGKPRLTFVFPPKGRLVFLRRDLFDWAVDLDFIDQLGGSPTNS
jgi:hypothetical protein